MTGQKQTRAAISAFFIIMGMVFASWASRIPDVQQMYHLSNGQLGTLLFAIPFGHAFSIIPVGMMVSRFGSRRMTTVSMLMYAISLFAIPFATNYITLFLMLMALGFTANAMDVSINTQAVVLETQYGRSILSAFHGMWSLGGLFGGIIGAMFANIGMGLMPHFTTIFVISLAVIAICRRFLIQESTVQHAKENTEPFNLKHIDSILWILGIIGFAGMFCEGATYDWSAVYFSKIVKPDATFIRAGYIAGVAAMTIGRLSADRFITRYGHKKVLECCSLFIIIGFALVVTIPDLIPASIGYALTGLGISAVCPICYSQAGRHPSVKTSTALTFVSSLGFIGFLISPPIIGWVSEVIGLRLTMIIGSLSGLTILIFSRTIKKGKQKQATLL